MPYRPSLGATLVAAVALLAPMLTACEREAPKRDHLRHRRRMLSPTRAILPSLYG